MSVNLTEATCYIDVYYSVEISYEIIKSNIGKNFATHWLRCIWKLTRSNIILMKSIVSRRNVASELQNPFSAFDLN